MDFRTFLGQIINNMGGSAQAAAPGAPNAAPQYYSPPEQALLSPRFGLVNGGLQQMRDTADQQARTQTALADAGLAASGELPELLGLRGAALLDSAVKAVRGAGDLAGNIFDMGEDQRANDIYNQRLWDTINNTLTAQARAQSENSAGRPFRGFLGP